jgi:hypothetical protein
MSLTLINQDEEPDKQNWLAGKKGVSAPLRFDEAIDWARFKVVFWSRLRENPAGSFKGGSADVQGAF